MLGVELTEGARRATGVISTFLFESNLPISLLFVDGDHSYDGCYSDLQAWLPKMTSDGIVVFHDYIWSDGVKQAVQEFLREEKLEYLGLTQSLFWARVC